MRIEFSSGDQHDGVRVNYVRPARIAYVIIIINIYSYFNEKTIITFVSLYNLQDCAFSVREFLLRLFGLPT